LFLFEIDIPTRATWCTSAGRNSAYSRNSLAGALVHQQDRQLLKNKDFGDK
jgi:hypothetical protein